MRGDGRPPDERRREPACLSEAEEAPAAISPDPQSFGGARDCAHRSRRAGWKNAREGEGKRAQRCTSPQAGEETALAR